MNIGLQHFHQALFYQTN